MTALNKQALREAAENATPGEWKRMMRNSDELMTTFHGVAIGNVFVELTTGKRDIFDAEFIAAANPATVLALLDELEAAEKRISEQSEIVAAAEKLVRCKGRYHSELNYRALAKLFGVTTPDLPPLKHENVHYADAAEMEIAALRQRIAELQVARDKCFLSGLKTGWEYGIADDTECYNREIADAQAVIDRAAGIGVKGE